ncbi:hypothetical protein [Massilia sp. erpn]|uniref:hypothetical protein n=1 Tax=Massilia sp. erpn TaxID=2738142 RepID=UPI00210308CA|nr:hypothetical protein [Massilia sp. erpn]
MQGAFNRHTRSLSVTAASAALLLACAIPAQAADGLSDLKAALARLQGTAPLKASLETKTWRRIGEGKEMEESSGQASVGLEENGQGLQLIYGKDVLARMDGEQRAQVKNPNAKTPTLSVAREFSPVELRTMTAAAANLARQLERVTYKSEKTAVYGGNQVRQLTFSVPLETLSDRDRKYIKDFEGTFDLWIAADGTPLASHTLVNGSGRAFVVVGFDFRQEEDAVYGVSGDRLLMLRRENKRKQSGGGDKSDERITKTLQPAA